MKTYVISGVVRWTEYCSCSSCGGHERSRDVKSYMVKCDDLSFAMKAALKEILSRHANGNWSSEEWEDETVTEIEEGKPLSHAGLLLEEAPPDLVQRAKSVGVPNFWNSPVSRKVPIIKE